MPRAQQPYHKTLKIWLQEITRAMKGIYSTDPNIKTNYYAYNYDIGDMIQLLKRSEEHLLSRAEIFDLIVSDVKSMEEELQAYKDKYGEMVPVEHCSKCKFKGWSDLGDDPSSLKRVVCNKFHSAIYDEDGTGNCFVGRKCFEEKENEDDKTA